MISTSAYAVHLEKLVMECRSVMIAAAEHAEDWPMLGLNIVLDKIDQLDIDHDGNPNRCPATVDMLSKITS